MSALSSGHPLPLISPVDRRRLEAVVDRLGAYHDRFARHLRRASAAIERLRQSAISVLDRIDGDLEPDGCDEPSLAFQEARSWDSQDSII